MSNKIGFIGCGKMGAAIIKGLLKSGFSTFEDIMASQKNSDLAKINSEKLGIEVITDNKKLVKNSDIIFLAIKPYFVKDVLEEIKDEIDEKKLIVSIAAGVKTSKIENLVDKPAVIRIMPNTPMLLSAGMSGVCKGKYASEEQFEYVLKLVSNLGKAIKIDEDKIDVLTAVSGCGPAYFYLIIEEMAKAAAKLGLNYEDALILAAQTALGSAKMVLETGESPEKLIQNVATKGGSTEVGVNTMKEFNTEKIFEEVIKRSAEKSEALGKD